MPSTAGLQFLRPYLSKDISISRKSIYIRFFNITRCHSSRSPYKFSEAPVRSRKSKNTLGTAEINKDRGLIEARIKELEKGKALRYPRIQSLPNTLTVAEYQRRYASMTPREEKLEILAVYGMPQSTVDVYGLMVV